MKKALVLLVIILVAIGVIVYVVNPPESTVAVPTTIEWHTGVDKPVILFVHGLNGDAYKTWGTTEETSFMQLLASDPAFADFGIASIRYPTGLFGTSPSITRLSESFAKCLDTHFNKNTQIVIVAHSLGGIVARMGLAHSDWAKRQHQIVTMITLASPFEGSTLPNRVRILSFFGLASRQMGMLGVGSEVLHNCNLQWTKLVRDNGSRIRQFAASEGRPIEGVVPVVTEASATKNIPPGCTFMSVTDDHFSIAKPRSLKEGIGKQVRDWLLPALNRWSYPKGETPFEHSLEIPAGGVLLIEAGATLRFKKGAKLICRGRVEAKGGSDQEMITFDFDETDVSESGIVLRGQGVAGSEFINCRFLHGNGTRIQKPNPSAQSLPNSQIWGEGETKMTEGGSPYGGAVLLIGAVNVRFTRCNFSKNIAYMGGAMALLGSRRIQINSSVFESNASGCGGGGIFAQESELYIDGKCQFLANETGSMVAPYAQAPRSQAACGGAIYLGFAAHCDLHDVNFTKNQASNAGGAIFIQDTNPPAWQLTSVNQIHNVTFTENLSHGGNGGALRCDGESRGHLVDVTFADNYSRPKASPPGPAFDDESKSGFQTTSVRWFRGGLPYEEDYRPQVNPVGRPVLTELTTNARCFKRAEQRIIDTIVIHSISAEPWILLEQLAIQLKGPTRSEIKIPWQNAEEAKFSWRLCKEILELHGESCHYMIDREGQIHQFVRDKDIAYHSGGSIMPAGDDRAQVNDFSLGIQLVGTDRDVNADVDASAGRALPFTPEQYAALGDVLLELSWKYNIPAKNIVGHSEISGARAVTEKLRTEDDQQVDPGPAFDWELVRERLVEGLKGPPKPLLQTSKAQRKPAEAAD